MKETYLNKLEKIEALIKNAQREVAQRQLLRLRKRKIPDEFLLQFSNVARRAELPGLAITALSPAVFGNRKKRIDGSEAHRTEYAACLIRVGARREAAKFLSAINLETNLDALFFSAGLLVTEWSYSKAIPLFRKYVEQTVSMPYLCSIGRINCALCLVFEEKYEEAALLINEVLLSEEGAKWTLVRGNAYRMLGGLEFYRGNYEFALNAFHHAHCIFTDSNSLDHFLIRKWVCLTNYFLSRGNKGSLQAVEKNRQEAVERLHWESVRDIDYQLAAFHQDESQLLKLYFGTPHDGFKARLLKRFPSLQIPRMYYWKLEGESLARPHQLSEKKLGLKPGLALYRLYQALISDFYRSFTAVELFEKTFPEDFYIPNSSEQRVHQVVSRLRKEFPKQLHLTIHSDHNAFRLVAKAPIEILCTVEELRTKSQTHHRIEELKIEFVNLPFTSAIAAKKLGLARRTMNEIISEALHEKKLTRMGSGNRTQYKLVERQDDKLKKTG